MKLFTLFARKDDRVAQLVCGEAQTAFDDICRSGISPLAIQLTSSLIAAIEGMAREVFCHSKTPEFREVGDTLPAQVLARYAAYSAWYFHKRFIRENHGMLFRAAGYNEITMRVDLADVESVRRALFPTNDLFVADAIGRTQEHSEMLDQKHNVGSYRFTEERFSLFTLALGLTDIDVSDKATRKLQADELGMIQDAELFTMTQAIAAYTAMPRLMPT